MRVLLYTHPAFFETTLHLSRELSRRVELHVLIEVSPWTWRQAGFDVPPLELPPGLVPAAHALGDYLPANLRAFFADVADVHLVVHRHRRSLSLASWRVTQQVLTYIRGLRPDVLHVDGVDQSLRLALGVPWRCTAPLVLSIHDPQPHSGEADWHFHLTRALLFRRTSRFVLYNSAAVDPFGLRYRISTRRVHALPLGVIQLHADRPSNTAADAGPVVLFFGRISPYKGLEVLYAAAALVAREVPGVRFVVAGQPIMGYQLPVPPRLPHGGTIEVIASYISNERARTLFESARVVACPYLDATQSAVILTSYGYGKPVVATRAGGLPEYVQDGATGLLVDAGDAHGLALALVKILQDESLRRKLRTGITDMAHGPRAWSSSADRLVDLYREAIGTTSGT